MRSLDGLKKAFFYGDEILKADEFLGDDGLPYCKKCRQPRFVASADGLSAMRSACECSMRDYERTETEKAEKARLAEFNTRQKLSLIGERYKNVMFADAKITDKNRDVYERCKRYVENADKVLERNIGLYIYGDCSSGKTYLTACICNELVKRGYLCVYTNLASILSEIRKAYNSSDDTSECEVVNRIKNYSFAFIDDFGKEFIGREYNPGNGKWAEEKLFEILNARYNAQRPTIFSSNFSISKLSELNFDAAVIERVNEMSTRVMKLDGDDFRSALLKEKSEYAKSLGI